jgi:hypothetical protein
VAKQKAGVCMLLHYGQSFFFDEPTLQESEQPALEEEEINTPESPDDSEDEIDPHQIGTLVCHPERSKGSQIQIFRCVAAQKQNLRPGPATCSSPSLRASNPSPGIQEQKTRFPPARE